MNWPVVITPRANNANGREDEAKGNQGENLLELPLGNRAGSIL